MTAKEIARLRKLEAETTRLREQLEKHMATYREQLFDLVELRSPMDVLRELMGGQK